MWWAHTAIVAKTAQNATVLSGSDIECAMHVQTSLTKKASVPPNPWLTDMKCLADETTSCWAVGSSDTLHMCCWLSRAGQL